MNAQTITTVTALEQRAACQRCGHRDGAGLASLRGIRVCQLCLVIAKVRARRAA